MYWTCEKASTRFTQKASTDRREKAYAEQNVPGAEIECDSSGRLEPVYYELHTRWVNRRRAEATNLLDVASCP